MRRNHCRGGIPGADRLADAPGIRRRGASAGTSFSRRDCAEGRALLQLSGTARICRGVTERSVARLHPQDIAHAATLLENAAGLLFPFLQSCSVRFWLPRRITYEYSHFLGGGAHSG